MLTQTRQTYSLPAPADGGQLICQLLHEYSVDHVFGHTGAVILPLLDAIGLRESPRMIVARHERHACSMALGYAGVTGKPGVVLVTSGPGATNTVPGIALARVWRMPMIVLTGQVATTSLGSDAFQEADITGISRPLVKWSRLVRHIDELPGVFMEAFDIATSGEPGPVLLDLPKDVLAARLDRARTAQKIHHWRAIRRMMRPIEAVWPGSAMPAWHRDIAEALAGTGCVLFHSPLQGVALPYAMGAACAWRNEAAIAVAMLEPGDIPQSALELCTAAQNKVPIKAILHAGDDAPHWADWIEATRTQVVICRGRSKLSGALENWLRADQPVALIYDDRC